MNEELDSQLSAMFDNELPAEECELLARRLSRDGELKARWGRYAVIGAVIRAERGVTLDGTVAGRVSAAISSEPVLGSAHKGARRPDVRWWQPLAGAALAASVAAISILWLRAQALGGSNAVPALLASAPAAAAGAAGYTSAATSDSFVVPPNLSPQQPMSLVPPTELADFVVAHSAFSWPVIRGSMLSALMVSEPGTSSTSLGSEQQPHDVHGNATQHPQK
jgi:negative regulator of sigma E activity